jgi:hypothetical protein
MYNTIGQASLMTWHVKNRSSDGMVRHAADSCQWQFIDEKWPEFASEACNIRLGLAIDGINPFAEKRSTWST